MKSTIVLVKLLPYNMPRLRVEDIIGYIYHNNFRIEEMRWIVLTRDEAERFYPNEQTWLSMVGEKVISNCQGTCFNPLHMLGTEDPLELGKIVKQWNVDYLTSRALPALEITGGNGNIVQSFREFLGPTDPSRAPKDTLRGRFALEGESGAKATFEKRIIYNTAHASDCVGEVEREKEILWAAQQWNPYDE